MNPLIKVINLASMLFAPAIIVLRKTQPMLAALLAVALASVLIYVIWRSRRAPAELAEAVVEVKRS